MKLNWFPNPKEYPDNRLFCLDLLRGLDMFYLAIGSVVLRELLKLNGASPETLTFFGGHPWYGFTLYDLIMPLFIFMCGAAIPFALEKRLENGRAGAAFWKHVLWRFVMLWVLGMFAQGSLSTFDLHHISPYNNTLQTIAFGYLVAAVVMLIRPRWIQIAIPVLLTVAYGLIVHFGGDYTKDGNVTLPFELKILNSFLPADNAQTANISKYGYTWFLPSMMFPVITLAGYFSTRILQSALTPWKKAASLAVYGGGSLAVGWLLVPCGVKMVKHIFSVSFTLQAIGWSILLLALLYVLTDIWKCRKGTGWLLLFGQFALTAYVLEAIVRGTVTGLWARFFGGLNRFFPESWGALVSAVGYAIVIFVIMILRRRLAQANRK